MQLIVDIELVGMLVYWFLRGNSLRYALVMSIVGISKIILNVQNRKSRFSSKQGSYKIALISKPFLPWFLAPTSKIHISLAESLVF